MKKRVLLLLVLVVAVIHAAAQGIYLTSQKNMDGRHKVAVTMEAAPINCAPVNSSCRATANTWYARSTNKPLWQTRYSPILSEVGATSPQAETIRVGKWRVGGSLQDDDDGYDPDNPNVDIFQDDDDGYDPDNPKIGQLADGLVLLHVLLMLYVIFIVRRRKSSCSQK